MIKHFFNASRKLHLGLINECANIQEYISLKEIALFLGITSQRQLVIYEKIALTQIVEALKMAGVEDLLIYQAVRCILDDKRVEIHIKPLCTRYSF